MVGPSKSTYLNKVFKFKCHTGQIRLPDQYVDLNM